MRSARSRPEVLAPAGDLAALKAALAAGADAVYFGCRNTVFNAEVQSAAELVPELLARGVQRFRVELVRESRREAERVLAAYGDLLAGRASPGETLACAGARAHLGVSRAPMVLMRAQSSIQPAPDRQGA